MNKKLTFYLLFSTSLLSGCFVLGPDYEKPSSALPQQWGEARVAKPVLQKACVPWWKVFNDPSLEALITEALQANANILLAMARVAEARAILGVKEADFLPQLNLNATAARGTNNSFGLSPTGNSNNFGLAGILNYEIDLWGKLARTAESARAQMLSKIYAKEAVQLTVSADVAVNYFSIQALYAQRQTIEKTIAAWEESYALQKDRYHQGYVNQLDLLQTKTQLEQARALLPPLQQNLSEQLNSLAVLLGRTPKELVEKTLPKGKMLANEKLPVVPLSTPSTVFEQRPDIRAAEQDLIAANAQIGAIKASYFPTLSLAALVGLTSNDLNALFKNASSQQWQVGGGFAGPLLTFGREEGSVEAAEAVKEQALIAYQQTVREAFKEVRNALSAETNAADQFKAEEKVVQAQEQNLLLSEDRYQTGYINYLDLLNAQRSLLQAQLNLIGVNLNRFRAAVSLYKALGSAP